MSREYFHLEQQIIEAFALPFPERWDQIQRLHEEKLNLLPNVDFQLGTPYAAVIENLYPWDIGAPLPHVVASGSGVYLVYTLSQNTGNSYKKEQITVLNGEQGSYLCALLEFKNLMDFRFGGANDEVIEHHPIVGIEGYCLHRIHNSAWIAELRKINAHHFMYNPDSWQEYKHFHFAFHDETFECIAKSFEVHLYQGDIKEVAQLAFNRLFE